VADRWIGFFGTRLLSIHNARLVWKTR
jgi:hypothetical protein